MADNRLPVFAQFIADLRTIWGEESNDESRMKRAQILLGILVQDDGLRTHSETWPSTEGRRNLLFYEDADYGFAINGVVRLPGRTGSIHDHNEAWVAYGLLVGTEILERFDRVDDRSRPDHAEVRLTSASQGQPGDVDLVEPFAIHAEQGGPARSVAVIVRSKRVAGRMPQGGYDRDTFAYVQHEGPEQIPYELTA